MGYFNLALVFSGGSTKLPLHVGVVKYLEERNIQYSSLYGNSAGSIICAALAIGFNFNDLKQLVITTDFAKLLKQSVWEYIKNIFTSSGLNSGNKLQDLLYKNLGQATFKELDKDLNIIGHSLSESSWVVFNKLNTPDMPIAKAARISSSIPILFAPIQYKNDYYVDGGISKDFPCDLIKEDFYIGHLIQSENKWNNNLTTLKDMAGVVLQQLIQSNCEDSIKHAPDGIVIRTNYEKSMLDFNVDIQEKLSMINLGYLNAEASLNSWLGNL